MKFKNGDEARVKRTNKETMYKDIEGTTVLILDNFCGDLYRVFDCIGGQWILDEEMLEPVDSTTLRMADGTIIGEFNTGGTLPTSEWSKLIFRNGSSIEALPQKDDAVRGKNHFCTGFRGGKTPIDPPEFVFDAEQAKELAERLSKELTGHFNAFSNNGISAKNGGKNSMKFTFYTEEGYRIDKSNNSKVETITTFVKINGFDNTYLGMATCDKVDYSEREGVINALANAMCNGNFDREFNKAVKDNARADKEARTCTYCGQLFDTVAEKEAHEKWHVERKKARRERYLLRKRAKEIAFEEQAQKMAKEMMGEQK